MILLLFLFSMPALGWDETGHQVVARIAWEHMTPEARARAIQILSAAPGDAGLRQLLPQDTRPLAVREREFFLLASTWPDLVRDEAFPQRRRTYHRGNWHYINFFWDQPRPGAPARDRQDLRPESTNIVERLGRLERLVAQEGTGAAERATALAWILHLVGDLHQPLHTSARVTSTEPRGDQGGNLFRLGGSGTLHGYWDGILRRTYRRRQGESEAAYVERIARTIMTAQARPALASRLDPGAYEAWAREGYELAKTQVYPASLRRNQTPLLSYRRQAYEVSEAAIALAGYRLAELLNRILQA